MSGMSKSSGISIHALRKESDLVVSVSYIAATLFQSTLSVRRATNPQTVSNTLYLFQSTLSVRRATRPNHGAEGLENISIHALRKESDAHERAGHAGQVISIHALRKESDSVSTLFFVIKSLFQSTLSVRRATPFHGGTVVGL